MDLENFLIRFGIHLLFPVDLDDLEHLEGMTEEILEQIRQAIETGEIIT